MDIWSATISVFLFWCWYGIIFIHPVGNCVVNFVYCAQSKCHWGWKSNTSYCSNLKSIFPSSINGAYYMNKWLWPWLGQKSSIDKSQNMVIQSMIQILLACFESFQLSLSTLSVHVDLFLVFSGMIFNQCHIFTKLGYQYRVYILVLPITGSF